MKSTEDSQETQNNVSIEKIERSFFDYMSNFYGKRDLSWIGCLFQYGLRDVLKVKNGDIHCSEYGINEVSHMLESCGIYEEHGRIPQALLHTDELPKDFSLFVVGPEYNNKTLRILCSSPEISVRDFEEGEIISYAISSLEGLVNGKHKDVKGEIKSNKDHDWQLNRIVLSKTWKMPIHPSFSFEPDMGDIQIFAKIYQGFADYQEKRDKSFRDIAESIVQEGLK